MARDKSIEVDKFSRELEEIFADVVDAGNYGALEGVRTGIRVGAREWRKDANDSIGEHTYRRHGKTYTSGAYARSIRSHMLSTDETKPAGEVGSPKLYYLSHLLEDGHLRVGGGRVKGVLHIYDKVAPAAFDAAIEAAGEAFDGWMQ